MNRYAKLLSLRIIFSLAILTTIAKDFYCHAQNNHLGVMQFSNTYISSSPQILAFQRDSTGIIWIGTSEGLYSYDGYRYISQYEPRHFSNVRIESNLSKTKNIPPKGVIFSDLICTFAMPLKFLLVLKCSTKVSEKSDMAKS